MTFSALHYSSDPAYIAYPHGIESMTLFPIIPPSGTDNAGNSFITGYFNNTATFGSTSLTSSGLQDIFIAKYNSSGVLLWVKKAGGTGSDIGFGIAFNSFG